MSIVRKLAEISKPCLCALVALTAAAPAFASGRTSGLVSNRVEITCATVGARDKFSVRFGFSRFTEDFWPDSAAYGAKLQYRVQDVDVGQFMNADGEVFVKIYTPDVTPANVDLSGLRLRLKKTGAQTYAGTVDTFTVDYEAPGEKTTPAREVRCQSK